MTSTPTLFPQLPAAAAGAAADLLTLLGSPLAAGGESGFHAMVQQALGKAQPAKKKDAKVPEVAAAEDVTSPVVAPVPVLATAIEPAKAPATKSPSIPVPTKIESSSCEPQRPAEIAESHHHTSIEPATTVPQDNAPTPTSLANIEPPKGPEPAKTTTPAATTTSISTQIADKIQTLVTQNGTHRITIRLDPEHLGEVRVVMTVREGVVHVRLAAGEHETRSLLTDGAPQLRQALESAGASDTKVVVRELPRDASATYAYTNPNTSTSTSTSTSTDNHQGAGTRGREHPPSDGSGQGTRQPHQHHDRRDAQQPERPTRRSGVDVSM